MLKQFYFKQSSFNISTQFNSIWPINRTLPDATTPGQSEPRSDSNKGVLHIPQSPSITGTSPSDLVSYTGHLLGSVLPLCREAVGVFYSPSRLGKVIISVNLVVAAAIIIIVIIITTSFIIVVIWHHLYSHYIKANNHYSSPCLKTKNNCINKNDN